MRVKMLLAAGIAAIGFAVAAPSVEAAPAGGLIGAIDKDAAQGSPVETVTWYGRRHCNWYYGEYYCSYGPRYRRWHDYGTYGYGHPYRYYYGYRRGWY